MKLLLTAIGRRVQLVNCLRTHFSVVGTDCSDYAPAIHSVDAFYRVPHVSDKTYLDSLLDVCRKEQIDLLVPLFEPEFQLLAQNRKKFEGIGTFLMLSDQKVLDICLDKWDMNNFFVENGFRTPQSFISKKDIDREFPLFIKPRKGMGSKNTHLLSASEELDFYYPRVDDPIVQEFIDGVEYTMDCICGLDGMPLTVVPRERIDVISGEVSKTRTLNDDALIKATKEVCIKLGGIGPLTIQCIRTKSGEIVFTEVNPRFGGGVPATIAAGVDYAGIIAKIVREEPIDTALCSFTELTMLRFDEAVFI